MEASKAATRDYPSFSTTPCGLWDVIYTRRSSRKYLPLELDDVFIESLEETVRLSAATRGAEAGSMMVIHRRDRVEGIRHRCVRSLQGAINLWLLRTPVSAFMVLAVPHSDVEKPRPAQVPLTAMAAEDCILWLTESGLATCWLGGFNPREVREITGLGEDMAVLAMISIGKPKPKIKARDVDYLIYRQVSRHRNPLSEIASLGTMDQPYELRDMATKKFSASPTQDVAGLLGRLGAGVAGGGDAPLELALEACLEAARVAPSASNAQKWHFIVVTGQDMTSRLANMCGAEHTWRAAIVGAGHPGRLDNLKELSFWMIDVPIAFSHMSLMAASMDLAVEVHVNGIDAGAVDAMTRMRFPLHTVGVMGIR